MLVRSEARRRGGAAAVLLAATVLGGCTRIDNALATVPFFSFMQSSPGFDPYEGTRPAPPGSVPYESPNEEQTVPPVEPNEASLQAFAAQVKNPVPMSDTVALRQGADLFHRYCFVCHGPTGTGNGPIIGPGKFPFALNLMLPVTVARSDGYIMGMITAGRGLMPEYGSKIPVPERWYIVNYVRTLQQRAAAGAGQAGAAPAGVPSASPGAGGAGAGR